MKNSTIRRYPFLLLTLCTVASVAQNTKYVNLFIGTSGDNGQVAPGAAAPFGMVCVCPDNDPRSHAGYDYAVTKVSGIAGNRLSGGGGNLRIRPVAPSQELHMKKNHEKATPGYYSTAFTNGIKTELTATHAMAVERYKFPRSISAALWVDFASTFEDVATCQYKRVSDTWRNRKRRLPALLLARRYVRWKYVSDFPHSVPNWLAGNVPAGKRWTLPN